MGTVAPLTGRRVLVTRAAGQASLLAEALQAQGGEVLAIPAIELAPPDSYCGLDAALTTLRSFDWVVFTSANAVSAFVARARRLGVSPAARRVAAIGPATARAVVAEEVADRVEVQPERAVAESLLAALRDQVGGRSVLVVRAQEARDVLVDGLLSAGAQVTIAVAYRTVVPAGSVSALRQLFTERAGALDVVTFTSGSSVTNLMKLLQEADLELLPGTVLASIGPITSQVLREHGFEPAVEAARASIESLVEGLVTYFGGDAVVRMESSSSASGEG